MGVYIPKMKMPLGCNLCGFYDVCKNSSKSIARYNGERAPDCPLIKIETPHGRLVDENKIHTGIRMEKNTEYRYFIDRVNAPTVLEAEDE